MPAQRTAKPSARPELGISGWTGILLACVAGFAVSVLRIVFLNYQVGLLAAVATGVGASYALLQVQSLYDASQAGRRRRGLLDGGAPKVKLAPSFEIYDPTQAEENEPNGPNGGAR